MTASKSSRSNSGFTLIEVMMVVAILAAVLAIGGPRLFNSAAQMRSSIRTMAVMTREIRNVARLYGSTMRLAISMNDEKGHSYWVESAQGNVTLMTADQEKALADLTSSQREDEKPKNDFAMDSRIMKKPQRLPRNLYFESVEYSSKKDPVIAGTAYVHFFPQGLAEDVAIHFTDRKTLNWTLTINPLTGRADVYERKVSLKELQRQ